MNERNFSGSVSEYTPMWQKPIEQQIAELVAAGRQVAYEPTGEPMLTSYGEVRCWDDNPLISESDGDYGWGEDS
ncbi:MAG TPA: hypothetical protein VFP32_00120 [Candidatus Saccharimonadales bacterium]|nr:hypothetical protein [Candidatus Saccharimonadales bacterium]